jgi:hypothetical protein
MKHGRYAIGAFVALPRGLASKLLQGVRLPANFLYVPLMQTLRLGFRPPITGEWLPAIAAIRGESIFPCLNPIHDVCDRF